MWGKMILNASMMTMEGCMTSSKIFVAGHLGMVGSAICRALAAENKHQIITRDRAQLDLTSQSKVNSFFAEEKPDSVYLAAAKVGGIMANQTQPASFIYQNLMIECNVMHAAYQAGVKSLLFLGSSCIYPKLAAQPMKEEALLSGYLEPTNEPYAIAKIAGIKLCESYNREYGVDYRSVMPTNLYGLNDNYDAEDSHVIPGLIRRFHEAKIKGASSVAVWGSGKPRREFLYADDLALACLFVMSLDRTTYQSITKPMQSHLNVGVGHDITIEALAHMIKKVVDFKGEIVFDPTKPDGAPQKLMDSATLFKLGFKPRIDLEKGLHLAYQDFLMHA
jgi:GDP-L-fucose synthase